MDIRKRSINHYLYLLLLFFITGWLIHLIITSYYDPTSPYIFSIGFFTVLNVFFGLKETSVLDNGVEKKYRFNFIVNIICLLIAGPIVTLISILIASIIYLPINQFKRLKTIDFSSVILHVLSTVISTSIMILVFFIFGGKVYDIHKPFDAYFPENVFAIFIAAAANFFLNTFIGCIWIKLYNLGNKPNILTLMKDEFFWLIRYDLWQAIYAVLITNTIMFYSTFLQMKETGRPDYLLTRDFIILAGFIVVAFIFYYPISQRLRSFNLLIQFNNQNVELKKLSEKLRETNKKITMAFVAMLEKRDPYTSGHSERVALYSQAIAKKLKFDKARREMLEMAALLHDIGKAGVDLSIINKTSGLTEEEAAEIRKHPIYGVELLQKIYSGNQDDDDEFKLICDIANSHHERYDGKGYPRGIKGEDISLEARIIAVADALDAMTSDRPYRKGMPLEQAIEEIKRGSGTQFCPKVVEATLECVKDGSLKLKKELDMDLSSLDILS